MFELFKKRIKRKERKTGARKNNEENVIIDAVIMSTKDSNFSKNSDEGFEQIQTHE